MSHLSGLGTSTLINKLSRNPPSVKSGDSDDELNELSRDDIQTNIQLQLEDDDIKVPSRTPIVQPSTRMNPLPKGIDFGVDRVVNKNVKQMFIKQNANGDVDSQLMNKHYIGSRAKPIASEPASRPSSRHSHRSFQQQAVETPRSEYRERERERPQSEHRSETHRGHGHRDMDDNYEHDDHDGSDSQYPYDENGDGDGEYPDEAEDQFNSDNEDVASDYSSNYRPAPQKVRQMSRQELILAKRRELTKLAKLDKKGYKPPKMYTMADSYEDMHEVRKVLEDEAGCDESIKWQRKCLIGTATGIEWLNAQSYNPFRVELDGWAESVFENINDYDEVFEELYHKYKHKISMSPELKLLALFASSGLMFHFSKSLMSKGAEAIPGFDDVMRNNPDIKNAYEQAALRQMNKNPQNGLGQSIGGLFGNANLGNLLGGFFGGGAPQPPPPPQPQQSIPRPQPQQQPISRAPPRAEPAQTRQPVSLDIELDGPSGVDNLLSSLTRGTNSDSSAQPERRLSIDLDGLSSVTSKPKPKASSLAQVPVIRRKLNLTRT
jgi:hypothetical protein